MIGPLPPLHRFLLVLTALLLSVAFGLWAGLVDDVPVGVRAGVLAGLTIGLGAAWLLVHDFHRRSAERTRTQHRPR